MKEDNKKKSDITDTLVQLKLEAAKTRVTIIEILNNMTKESYHVHNFIQIIEERAKVVYGYPLQSAIRKRLDSELSVLIKEELIVIYYIIWKIVELYKIEGQLIIGGSCLELSVISYILGITIHNPLPSLYEHTSCKSISIDFEDRISISNNLGVKETVSDRKTMIKRGHDYSFYYFNHLHKKERAKFHLYCSEYVKDALTNKLLNSDDNIELLNRLIKSIVIIENPRLSRLYQLSRITGIKLDDIQFNDISILGQLLDHKFGENLRFSQLIKNEGHKRGYSIELENKPLEDESPLLQDVITNRDDLLRYFVNIGLEEDEAFRIIKDMSAFREPKSELINKLAMLKIDKIYLDMIENGSYIHYKSTLVIMASYEYYECFFRTYYPKEYALITSND